MNVYITNRTQKIILTLGQGPRDFSVLMKDSEYVAPVPAAKTDAASVAQVVFFLHFDVKFFIFVFKRF